MVHHFSVFVWEPLMLFVAMSKVFVFVVEKEKQVIVGFDMIIGGA